MPLAAMPTWVDVPEAELVRLAKQGHIAAFEELMNRTRDLGTRVATCILKDKEEARDEVQNAFWLAYSRIQLFTYESKFSTWFIRILINCCYMRLRILRKLPLVTIDRDAAQSSRLPFEAVSRTTPEMELGKRQVHQALRRELNSIPPLLRVPIEMHYIRELPMKEVAQELGVSVAAAKSRLHRAQMYLRERMLKHAPRRGPVSLTAA